jgi:hypothetical protein
MNEITQFEQKSLVRFKLIGMFQFCGGLIHVLVVIIMNQKLHYLIQKFEEIHTVRKRVCIEA